jgi:hypothetical protein
MTRKILIVVEGSDDKRFFKSLLSIDIASGNFDIAEIKEPRGGKSNFFNIKDIEVIINASFKGNDFEGMPSNVLFICDADFGESGEKYSGFTETQTYLKDLIENSDIKTKYPKTKFDFFILPNNKDDGNLDTLFMRCAAEKITKKTECAKNYLKCLGEEPSSNKQDKLLAQLLILGIGHKKGLKNVGEVADQKIGYWDFSHKSITPLKNFLKKFQ